MPSAAAQSFVQTKEPELKNAFDDWLARIVCFAFSISPQALVSQMNRATAEVQKSLSQEEGFEPILAWVKALVDEVLAREFPNPATGAAGIEFVWTPNDTLDPVAQEQILSSYTSRGILTLNEARATLGRAPEELKQFTVLECRTVTVTDGLDIRVVTSERLLSSSLLIGWRRWKYICEPLDS